MRGDSPDSLASPTGAVEQDRPGGKKPANPEDGTTKPGSGHREGQNGAFSELGDEDLLRRFQDSCDDFAFDVLYQRHTPPVIHMLIFSYSLNEQDAKDIMQETWIYFLRKIPHLAFPCNVGALLQKAARHGALNFLLKQRRCDLRDPLHFDAFEGQSAVCRTLRSGDLWNAVKSYVTPTEYRVLDLHFSEGLKYAEISHLQGVPSSTVKWHAREGCRKLRARKIFEDFSVLLAS
jgi:RNA polymerase sigma factor (sigma-70 family)